MTQAPQTAHLLFGGWSCQATVTSQSWPIELFSNVSGEAIFGCSVPAGVFPDDPPTPFFDTLEVG